jgi:hypothetical protein
MMTPKTLQEAQTQVRIFMRYRLTGYTRRAKEVVFKEYDVVIKTIWNGWKIGLFQIECGHVLWFFCLAEDVAALGSDRTYRRWLRLRELMEALGVYEDWEPQLRGCWRNPKGRAYQQSVSNAGRKPKYCGD